MPILNYTTDISTERTIAQISTMLTLFEVVAAEPTFLLGPGTSKEDPAP